MILSAPKRMQMEDITASIHSEDLAHVLALVPMADISALVRVPGYLVVAGIAALPHPSFAHMAKAGRCLVS
jgi:hypothetical protein